MDSWIRSFSLRSRPCRNSLRASSEEVVTGILPAAFGSALVATGFLLVLSSTFAQPLRATVAATDKANKKMINLFRDIGVLLRLVVLSLRFSALSSPFGLITAETQRTLRLR